MFNRWEWLESIKPESATAVAVRHLAKLVADQLLDWPPPVVLGDEKSKYSEILSRRIWRPSNQAFVEAIRRARWELARDYDAIDHYERNHLLEKACPEVEERIAAEFIGHYILESFYTLMERTDYRVKRGDVKEGVEIVERRLRSAWAGLAN